MLLVTEFTILKLQFSFFSFEIKGLQSVYVLKENHKQQQQIIQTQNNLFKRS